MTAALRILHVVGGVGRGNPYGGPSSVAVDQVSELRRRGHRAELVAPQLGASGTGDGHDVRSFRSFRAIPGAGFSGVVSPAMSWWILRRVRDFDLVHVHLARDLTTTPAALTSLLRRMPYVVQTHGMVDASSRRAAALLDAVAVRRVLHRAAAVLCLTASESDDVAAVTRSTRRVIVPNGVRCSDRPPDPPDTSVPPSVLFASRLAPRKRPDLFVEAARRLVERGTEASFVVAGPDEGMVSVVDRAVMAVGRSDKLGYVGALDRHAVAAALSRCSVLVLPADDEPFGMVVVEALAAGRAVVVASSCGLAPFVERHSCGRVVPPGDVETLTMVIDELVRDREATAEMGRRGWSAVRDHLAIDAVVDRLEECYALAVTGSGVAASERHRRTRS